MSLNEFCNFQDMVDENIWIEKIHVHEYAHTWIGDEEMFKFIFINNFNLFPKLPSFYTSQASIHYFAVLRAKVENSNLEALP